MDAVARSVGRRRRAGHRSFLDRLLGRDPSSAPDTVQADLRDPGEDVWKALRF
jgi:hypothetical protein